MRYKNIILVNADPIKNAGNIKEYFLENSEKLFAFHFYPGYSNKLCYFEEYNRGKKIINLSFGFYKGKNYLIKTLLQYLCFIYVSFRYVEKKTTVITNAPIFCIANSVLMIFKSFNYVLWIGDYYNDNGIVMRWYNLIVNYYNKRLKNVIYLTPPLKKVYFVDKGIKNNRKIINLGIKKNYGKRSKVLKNKFIIGFIGVVRKQQGIELIFAYLKENKTSHLEIVGEGYHLSYYKNLAKKLKINDRVKFHGFVENLSGVFRNWTIGIAPYENTPDNLSRYCEPTKIKDYLSFGLPVITTKTTYFAEELEKFNAGIVIEENSNSFSDAASDIVLNYDDYTDGAENLVNKYEYKKWYDRHFMFLK